MMSPATILRRLRVSTSPFTRTLPSATTDLAAPPCSARPSNFSTLYNSTGSRSITTSRISFASVSRFQSGNVQAAHTHEGVHGAGLACLVAAVHDLQPRLRHNLPGQAVFVFQPS